MDRLFGGLSADDWLVYSWLTDLFDVWRLLVTGCLVGWLLSVGYVCVVDFCLAVGWWFVCLLDELLGVVCWCLACWQL